MGGVLLALAVAEIGYRVIDPFPYFPESEVNRTEHGNLTEYDPLLGWRGVPGGRARFTTKNASVWLQHNAEGFRDIEPEERSPDKPAIVFLGDSFTWGYEVEFDEMFVSLLRERREDFELFNLSHRGYGTDQELMIFRDWRSERRLERVVLMFAENDVADNNSDWRNRKPKPRFELGEGGLRLTDVPVSEVPEWDSEAESESSGSPDESSLGEWLLRSHLYRDVELRIGEITEPGEPGEAESGVADCAELDLRVTRAAPGGDPGRGGRTGRRAGGLRDSVQGGALPGRGASALPALHRGALPGARASSTTTWRPRSRLPAIAPTIASESTGRLEVTKSWRTRSRTSCSERTDAPPPPRAGGEEASLGSREEV